MTDEIRDTVFRLKELGWMLQEEISRVRENTFPPFSPIKVYTSGFRMMSSNNCEGFMFIGHQPHSDDVFINLALIKVLESDEEYDSLFKIISSVKTLDDIEEIVKFWKTVKIH